MIPEIEKKSKEEIKIFQEEKLREQLYYLQENSPYYQKLFKENSIGLSTVVTLEDLKKIPVTTKNFL